MNSVTSTAKTPIASNKPGYWDAPSDPRAVKGISIRVKGSSQAVDRKTQELIAELNQAVTDYEHDGRDYVVAVAPQESKNRGRILMAYADDFANGEELSQLAPGDPVVIAGQTAKFAAFIDTHDGPGQRPDRAFSKNLLVQAPLTLAVFATFGLFKVAVDTHMEDVIDQDHERARALTQAAFKPSPFIEGLRAPKR